MTREAPKSSGEGWLCFGGSFNPIHHGHLICARAAAEKGGFEKVLLIPSRQPPHKPENADIAKATDRLEMCRQAVKGSNLFEISDIELGREGPSYTIDTVRELKRQGWKKVHWLIGADMVRILPQWHKAAELVAEVEFVIMARAGWEFGWEKMELPFRKLSENVVETPSMAISATEIRKRVRERKGIEYFVPEEVRKVIEERGLYR